MTSEFEPAPDIHDWLMSVCGATFSEASALRRRAVTLCFPDKTTYEARSREVAAERKKHRKKRKARHSALVQAAYDVNTPPVVITREPDVPSCVTCKSVTFDCGCAVQTVAQIPF